jgi:hypothetical protein
MKNQFYFVAAIIVFCLCFADQMLGQSTFVSRVSSTTICFLTIKVHDNQITYERKFVEDQDHSIQMSIYDYDRLLTRQDDRIINNSEYDYWFIPFEVTSPLQFYRQNAWCVNCDCNNPSTGGTCSPTGSFGIACNNNSCNCCNATIVPCNEQLHVLSSSGGVFIIGNSCQLSE